MNKKLLATALSLTALIAGSGCKKYLDVNTNPNVAQDAPVNLILPSTEIAIGSAIGVDFQINGSIWAEYYTQSPVASQYKTLEQYNPSATTYDRSWILFYENALKNLRVIETKSKAQNLKQYLAIAEVLEAYCFQNLTDAWGDIPYTQALKGTADQGGILSPKYDAQSLVYDGVLSTIDSSIALMDPNDASAPGGDDLIFNGDMDKWYRFANTLKLKMLLRLSEINPGKAQAGIAALYATSPEFIDNTSDAQIIYSATPGSQNPLYSEEVGLGKTQNLVASRTVVDSMNSNNDPRAFQFFSPVGSVVVGITQGDYGNSNASASAPTYLVGADALDPNSATAPVKFISSYESDMLQAEAAARGWGTGSAQSLFEQGITDNFLAYGLATTDAQAYIAGSYWGQYPTGGGIQAQVRHIITQKWFCMCGNQGFEAWTEHRRTNYPRFLRVFCKLPEGRHTAGTVPVS